MKLEIIFLPFVDAFVLVLMLYLLSPRLCFFIVLKRDLSVYRDDSLTN